MNSKSVGGVTRKSDDIGLNGDDCSSIENFIDMLRLSGKQFIWFDAGYNNIEIILTDSVPLGKDKI